MVRFRAHDRMAIPAAYWWEIRHVACSRYEQASTVWQHEDNFSFSVASQQLGLRSR